jgi:hypothetical protein
MSAKGAQALKLEICRAIKLAAQTSQIAGDEPLVVLLALAAKMVSEISDDVERIAMAKAAAESFPALVEMLRRKELELPQLNRSDRLKH